MKKWNIYRLICLLFFVLFELGCGGKKKTLFFKEDASQSGIYFNNEIRENDSINLMVNEYTYMGAGVGIGDFNNDGLPDIFFAGNQTTSRLYLNKGENKFADITEMAGLYTDSWCTGVSVVDINNDGYPDIFICVSGNIPGQTRKNLLFINNHDLTFTENAEVYGLTFTGYSTQAVFFDYDRDGDLDMYLLNHRLDSYRPNDIRHKDNTGNSPAADRLFRNEGIDKKTGHPIFKDVTISAGIGEDGYGLGIAVSDLNGDGWPDIYISNDYLANDELWLNNKNGTFTNCIGKSIRHQSYSGMGIDAADINNDGKMDLMTLDMMPENNSRKKIMFSFLNYERYQMERDAGFDPEFVRNMLQLNNGVIIKGDTSVPFFSEIGQLAGISETDWSWSILFADFDNDGWKDIHVTNGMGRDMTNEDFVKNRAEHYAVDNVDNVTRTRLLMKKLEEYKSNSMRNYLFLNNHHLQFDHLTDLSGINENNISNGAAYADLDNDGDLDLVTNNINDAASVYLNTTRKNKQDSVCRYLDFLLVGDSLNKDAIGTKISLFYQNQTQVAEEYPVRGYLSTVSKKIHFGLGEVKLLDSVIVIWPDGEKQIMNKIKSDQTLRLTYTDAKLKNTYLTEKGKALFTEVSIERNIHFKQTETYFNDYSFQRLLPQKYSQLGPFISTGDINKDGLMDFFIGNAFNYSGKVFLQNMDGMFTSSDLVLGEKKEEDMGSLIFDADGDGNPDLIIAGGSDEFSPASPVYIPKFYINDGAGHLMFKPGAIPNSVLTRASVVVGADLDGDGDIDLFIGGRVSANFPMSPRSYILRNDHGVFTDITSSVCPELQNPGMVTSAVWTDLDNDHHMDLVIAGEWMPIRFFRNQNGKLFETTGASGLKGNNGQWRSLVATDIDNDGDIDLIAGNLGGNNKFHVHEQEPMMLFAADLDNNGSIDPVLFYYIKNESGRRELFPAMSRDILSEQVPSIKKKFLFYKDYADARFDDLFNVDQRQNLLTLKCEETRTCVFENKGNGKFEKHPLSIEAQFAPVNGILCEDFDGDGKKDLLLAGNEYQTEIMTGRYDASYGLFLKGVGKFGFRPVSPVKSGFIVNGDVKDMKTLKDRGGHVLVLVAVNNDSLRVFQVN